MHWKHDEDSNGLDFHLAWSYGPAGPMTRDKAAWLICLIGAVFLAIGGGLALQDLRFWRDAQSVTLAVVAMQEKTKDDGEVLYRPMFELRMAGEPKHRHVGPKWTSSVPHAVGDLVPGYYNARDGKLISNALKGHRNILIFVLLGLGATMMGCALIWLWRQRR